MILISFLVLGGVSITRIPLVLFPDINEPGITVVVPYPNATPDQVLETITKPLEEALSTIPNVTRIRSTASPSQGEVRLQFGWDEEMEFLRSEVRAKVEQARKDLPGDVDQILVLSFNTSDIPIIEGRISSGRDLQGSYDFLDLKIKKPLERVAGVAEVQIGGVERRQIEINLRLDDLKLYKVDVGSLFQKLDSANLNLSLGSVDDQGYRYNVITDGAADSIKEIQSFPINERGLELQDIADVELREPPRDFGRHLNREFAISLEIRKASDANTVETVNRIMTEIDRMNEDPTLQGIEVLVWHNSGKEITKSLSGLLNAGMLGAFLAVVVLFLFLRRLGATLIVGSAIPFSIISAVGFLYLMGNTLNVLSMMGLMLSTGMLVDNAVVVMESIFRHLEKGEERLKAARIGTQEVLTAVIASTLTSVIIFVPLVFGKKSNISIFLGHTGVAIMVTLFCSLFISLTLIPLAAARLLNIDVRERPEWQKRLIAPIKKVTRRAAGLALSRRKNYRTDGGPTLLDRYTEVLKWTLSHRAIVTIVSIVVISGSFVVLQNLPDSSPEAEEQRELSIDYDFSENYHYAKIEADFVNSVEEYLFANQESFKIKDVYSFYGNNSANTRLYFDTDNLQVGELTEIRKKIADGLPVIPGAEIRLGRQDGSQGETWIGVNLYGEDSVRLLGLADKARKQLEKNVEFNEIHTALDRGEEEVQITLHRALAKNYGVSPESVAGILGIVLRGQRIRGFRGPEGEVDIWVKLRASDRENLEDLKSMVVGGGPNGENILFSQVADFHIVKTPGWIQRENRQTYTELVANWGGEERSEGMDAVTEVMDSLDYPQGYGWSYGFWTERHDQENQDFMFNLLLALFMVYFVMASLFESLAHPFAIMISLLFAFVGVAWFLLLTGTPFNIMAMIGSLILIGIVVNNGIVLIDHINNLRRAGMDRGRAIVAGCRERFRPILMTATTTVVGLMPLAIGDTSLFELRYFPMARTIMGGLMTSSILILVVLPTVYTLIDDLSLGLRSIWFDSTAENRVREASAE
jgi:HAE1 family hydrophobic/amphiphilic exporter-1